MSKKEEKELDVSKFTKKEQETVLKEAIKQRKIKKQEEKEAIALQVYYELGKDRSLPKLEAELKKRYPNQKGYSLGWLNKASARCNWKEKLKELEKIEIKERHDQMIRMAQMEDTNFVEKLSTIINLNFEQIMNNPELLNGKTLATFLELWRKYCSQEEVTDEGKAKTVTLSDEDKKFMEDTMNRISSCGIEYDD